MSYINWKFREEVHEHGCSFVPKLSWKKKLFLKKYLYFLQNRRHLHKKMFLYGKKIIEKNRNESVKKNLISEIYFYIENVCYKQNINLS